VIPNRSILPGFGLAMGFTLTYLSPDCPHPVVITCVSLARRDSIGFWER